MEFLKALILVIFSLTCWTAAALFFDRRGHRHVNRGLALVLISLSLPQLYIYTRFVYPPDGLFVLALVAQATLWLKGPLLWGMVRVLMGQRGKSDWQHCLPFFAVLAGLVTVPQWMFEWGLGGLLHALTYLAGNGGVVQLRQIQSASAGYDVYL